MMKCHKLYVSWHPGKYLRWICKGFFENSQLLSCSAGPKNPMYMYLYIFWCKLRMFSLIMNEIYYTFTLIDAFFSFAGFQCPTVTQTKNPAVHEIHETCPSVTIYFTKKLIF